MSTTMLSDDEFISLCFDLDQASQPPTQESNDGSVDSIEEQIPGFAPIEGPNDNHTEQIDLRQDASRENFSGGTGCYLWTSSPEVMLSGSVSAEEVRQALGIEHTSTSGLKVGNLAPDANDRKEMDRLPSESCGINWTAELLDVLRRR